MTPPANKQSAVSFSMESRIHISIPVSNLSKSLDFYKVLFGSEPTKIKPGYAKFETEEPPVNFVLEEKKTDLTTPSGHFGVQVKSTETVLAMKKSFENSGLTFTDEMNVNCCYALQDKFWVQDPDNNRWEIFVVLDNNLGDYYGNERTVLEGNP